MPRAFETALAMGYAVDEQSDAIGIMPGDANAEINWPQSFANIARVIARGGAGARFAREQARVWRALVAALPENGRALVISHGGMIEAGAIACAPDADHRAWGDALGYCEGARLSFENDECMNVQVLRVEGTAISNQ
ncbi:MAG: hypothetical protein HY257_06670 [Chloroflexi bacterium]|nr:hypothetical protein [Chloroflexota bacterium]